MASPKKAKAAEVVETTDVAQTLPAEVADNLPVESDELSADMFGADAGSGMENADRDSFAIPFLRILQKTSPQTDEGMPQYIAGARAGVFLNSVSNRLMEGKAQVDDKGAIVGGGVLFLPCAFQRRFLRWGPRSGDGGGYKGEILPERVQGMIDTRQVIEADGRMYFPLPDGTIDPKRSDILQDTRNHFGLILNEDGSAEQVLLSLVSTQIKKSKQLLSILSNVRIKNGAGAMVTPPTWYSIIRLTTVMESNDQGSWHGVRVDRVGDLKSKALYEAAKAFHDVIAAGEAKVAYDTAEENAGAGSPDPVSSGRF